MKRFSSTNSIYQLLFVGLVLLSVFCNETKAEHNPRMELMARRAAYVDALRNLSETIYGLRLDSGTTVRNFVVASDVMRTRLSVEIQGAEEVDYVAHEDGMAEVTVEITLGAVETILGRRLVYDGEIIEAIGYGAPPGMSTSYNRGSSPGSISGDSIRAEGYGLPPDDRGLTGPEQDLLGMRAARNDALRNLAEKVARIQVTADSTVRDFAVQSDTVRTKIRTVLSNARIISETKLADGRYKVELETDTGLLSNLDRNP